MPVPAPRYVETPESSSGAGRNRFGGGPDGGMFAGNSDLKGGLPWNGLHEIDGQNNQENAQRENTITRNNFQDSDRLNKGLELLNSPGEGKLLDMNAIRDRGNGAEGESSPRLNSDAHEVANSKGRQELRVTEENSEKLPNLHEPAGSVEGESSDVNSNEAGAMPADEQDEQTNEINGEDLDEGETFNGQHSQVVDPPEVTASTQSKGTQRNFPHGSEEDISKEQEKLQDGRMVMTSSGEDNFHSTIHREDKSGDNDIEEYQQENVDAVPDRSDDDLSDSFERKVR